MSAAVNNIIIEQGTTWYLGLILKKSNGIPVNLTGYSARGQIRRSHKKDEVVLAEFTVDIDPKVKTGKIALSLSEEQTTALTFTTAVYDVELIDANGIVKRLIQGKVTLSPEVTRPPIIEV